MININRQRTDRRKRRVSANIHGTIVCPRICVYRSNKNIYVQAIDDDKKITLTSSTDMGIHNKIKGTKINDLEYLRVEIIGRKKITLDCLTRSNKKYKGRYSWIFGKLEKAQ